MLKLGIEPNSNVLNVMVMFAFYDLDRKYLFLANLIKKKKKMSVLAEILYPDYLDGDVPFFSFFSFWANLVQKIILCV